MKYALNLAEDGRILSATYEQYANDNMILVDSLPDGDISDYIYQNNEFVYTPLCKSEIDYQPSQLDIIEAQVTYTAMMTDTLLEV